MLGMGQSASCSCTQCLGLSTRWTEEGNGCDWWPLIVIVLAASCGCCRWWVAAWSLYVLGVARFCTTPGPFDPVDSGVGGCPWCIRLLPPSSWCTVVAFGGSWPGRSTVSASHASVRRGVFPGCRELARGGRVPLRRSGRRHTFVPLRRHWVVCRRLCHAAVARVSTTLGPWGLLAMWHWVASVPSFALGVAMRCCGGPGVVACTSCKTRATCLGATLGAWLCRQDDGGGGTCSWALAVVGGACPVTALVEVVGCGALPRHRRLLYARNLENSFFTCHSIIASIASGSAHLSFNLLSISNQIKTLA